MSESKILFILKSPKTPSSRIRGIDTAEALNRSGILCETCFFPKTLWEKYKFYKKLRVYDIIVLQKKMPSWLELREIRKNSKKLIFDFDDAIYCKNASPSDNPLDYQSPTRAKKFARIIATADEIVAANNILAGNAREISPNAKITVIPSPVDAGKYAVKNNYEIRKIPVIGWIGTKSALRYLDSAADALCEIRKKKDFILRVISDCEYSLAGICVENLRWSIERQFCEIRNFDVGIMPLTSDPFSDGKSAYKLLQYLASGVPAICSPVGMNADVAQGGKFALTANTNSELAEKALFLFENRELRETLGKNGRCLILEKYDLSETTKLWKKILSDGD
jgi:glycosyltransferase involved in cell wall biosynthesis